MFRERQIHIVKGLGFRVCRIAYLLCLSGKEGIGTVRQHVGSILAQVAYIATFKILQPNVIPPPPLFQRQLKTYQISSGLSGNCITLLELGSMTSWGSAL